MREARIRKNMSQKALAREAEISQTLLSQIEHGNELATDNTAERVADILELDKNTRQKLYKTLLIDRKSSKLKTRYAFSFGEVLANLLEQIKLPVPDLARRVNHTSVAVRLWTKGLRLPSDETMASKLLTTLRDAGVSERDLRKLKLAHIEDRLVQLASLTYLNETEQARISSCIRKCLRTLK